MSARGIIRIRRGKSFAYRSTNGHAVPDRATLARSRALAIPPAWTQVWISSDADGNVRRVTSQDANDYLRETSGGPFTAKDHRTWAATMSAALLLCALEHRGSERGCKRCINVVLRQVADRLGHTPAICRASYVHPRLFEDFTDNRLARTLARAVRRRAARHDGDPIDADALRAVESVVARYLAAARRAHA